jgi:glycosyltransferase involved in cell wall biosynthesis
MDEHKVDVVMWTKNGELFLPAVLRRIDEVIPSENIANKIMIDDHSDDETAKIGASYGWEVCQNPRRGVSAAANEALKLVSSTKFVSAEQDLLLADDWWEKVPHLLKDENVVAASGVRVPDKPASLRLIGEYTNGRNELQTKSDAGFRYGKTLDNTIYKTDLLRKIGGFPEIPINAGVDGALVKSINDAGYQWKVDFSVVSVHLRLGFLNELKHSYWYGTESRALSHILEEETNVPVSTFEKAIFSPVRGMQIAFKKKCWEISFVYPLIRASIFLGVIKGYLSRESIPYE